MSRPGPDPERSSERVEEYAGGEIRVRRGIVNRWLLVVYLILFVWGSITSSPTGAASAPAWRARSAVRAERILIALAVLNLAILGLELAYSVVAAVLGLS